MVAHNGCRAEAYFGPEEDRLSNKFAIAKTAVTLHGHQSIGGGGNALTFNAFANTALRSDRQMALDTRKSKRSDENQIVFVRLRRSCVRHLCPRMLIATATESDLAQMKGWKSVCCRKYDPVAAGHKTTNNATGENPSMPKLYGKLVIAALALAPM